MKQLHNGGPPSWLMLHRSSCTSYSVFVTGSLTSPTPIRTVPFADPSQTIHNQSCPLDRPPCLQGVSVREGDRTETIYSESHPVNELFICTGCHDSTLPIVRCRDTALMSLLNSQYRSYSVLYSQLLNCQPSVR